MLNFILWYDNNIIVEQSFFKSLDLPDESLESLKKGEKLYKDGEFQLSQEAFNQGINIAQQELGLSKEVVTLINTVGILYLDHSDYGNAEKYFISAIKFSDNFDYNSNIDMMSMLGNLGYVYKLQNISSNNAEQIFNNAIKKIGINLDKWQIKDLDFNKLVNQVKKDFK